MHWLVSRKDSAAFRRNTNVLTIANERLRQLCPTHGPWAACAQSKSLCGLVQVFAVVKVSYILTTCPLNLTFLLQVVLSAALSRLLFIYLFYDNLATGGSLTCAILLCHVELSKYSTSKFQKKKNKQYAKRVHCFTVIYHISEIRQQR